MRLLPHRCASLLALAMLLACSSGGSTAVSPVAYPPATPPASTTWKLAWSDEFDGTAGSPVDAAKWGHDLGDGCGSGNCGWGNNEREYYTNASENVSLDGLGNLQIVARQAPAGLTCYYGACRYTSGKITTRGKMTAVPGRVEARIKLPTGQGLWPAFWMLGSDFPTVAWPACGELDIMENKGSNSLATSSAIHGPGYSGNTPFQRLSQIPGGGVTTDFHTYAVEWDAETVQFSVDSTVHYAATRAALQQYGNPVIGNSYFVILNLAVGGQFDGNPQSDAIFPATMLVDWVRVYAKQPSRARDARAPAPGTHHPRLTARLIRSATGSANSSLALRFGERRVRRHARMPFWRFGGFRDGDDLTSWAPGACGSSF